MRALKSLVKRSVAQLLYSSGLSWHRLNRQSEGRLIVLTYHRVLPASLQADSFSSEGIIVSPETFAQQMRLLKRRFQPLTAAEAAAVLNREYPAPPRACLVTFDDGWWDNLEFAAPILAEHDVPALLFVATDYIDGSEVFWQEHLSRLLFLLQQGGETSRTALNELQAGHLLDASVAQLKPSIRAVIAALKSRSMAEITTAVSVARRHLETAGIAFTPSRADRFLSWQELRKLVQTAPVEIGSHGCSHTPFTKLNREQITRELLASRDLIHEQLGVTTVDLAYPNGDCNDDIARLTQHHGYRMAFSTKRGYAAPSDDLQRLQRININEHSGQTDALFFARLSGLP